MTTTLRPEDCLATVEGTITVSGIDGPIEITRDRWGIPHIRAQSTHDAFFGQGFCMAQDRAFQIELYRRMAHGTSAAMLNRGLLRRDIQNRRLGFGRLATLEWGAQSDDARVVLQAYADGINAAIATQPEPWEFRTLGHHMEPWTPIDSLAVIKMVNAGTHWATKLRFGQVAAHLGPEAVEALISDLPRGTALIVPSGARWEDETHPFRVDPELAMGAPDGPVASGGGSNCWVIHGSKTASGKPMVAGDPHLALGVPGQWYVVHMECPEFTAAGPCNPCYPGPVFYGHNNRIAWTMTHAQGDRWDDYREQIRRTTAGPEARVDDDTWEALLHLEERFDVRGEESVTETIWLTRHGPVIAGDPTRDDEVIAARWGLAEPAHDTDAMLAVLRAGTAAEARAGFQRYDSVSGNFCFADGAGNIGYQYAGRIPKRPGWMVPVPGWDPAYDWEGDVPKAELPAEENPRNGFIVTANNRTVGPDYPHYLTYVSTRFRADRLRERMDDIETFDTDVVRSLQADQTSILARDLAARFAATGGADADGQALQSLLRGWDGALDVDGAAPVAYATTCDVLIERTVRAFFAQVPNIAASTAAEEYRILDEQLRADRPLMLMGAASWDDAIRDALAEAARRARERHGGDPASWRWGDEHYAAWHHNLGRDRELAPIVNVGDVPIGGDSTTPFASELARGGPSTQGVSYRQVFDLADLAAAQICIPPGNSGQPGSPHYADNMDRWRDVTYHPLLIDRAAIAANAEATLTLEPDA